MANSSRSCQRGYTYIGVLFVVALIGMALTGAALVWDVQQQRDKERELLFIGQQYIAAIESYYNAAPGGAKKYPRSIEELLRDPRYPTVKRHLRKPWRDPLTRSAEWGIILTKQGGIAGIHSLGNGVPLKQAGFGSFDQLLGSKPSYQEWKFVYIATADDTPEETTDDQSLADESNSNDEETDAEANETGEEETGEELLP